MISSVSGTSDSRWNFCGDSVPKQEVVFICQLITTFSIVVVALINLSLDRPNRELWSTLVGAGFGYLVPCPTIHRRSRRRRGDNESLHANASVKQFDELQPSQHSVDVHDQA